MALSRTAAPGTPLAPAAVLRDFRADVLVVPRALPT